MYPSEEPNHLRKPTSHISKSYNMQTDKLENTILDVGQNQGDVC